MENIFHKIERTTIYDFSAGISSEALCRFAKSGGILFVLGQGGFIEWWLLNRWCCQNGLGTLQLENRRHHSCFLRGVEFFFLLRKKIQKEGLLAERPCHLIFLKCARKRYFDAAKSYEVIVPILFVWRRTLRVSKTRVKNIILGNGTTPTVLGKVWYGLFQKRDLSIRFLRNIESKDSKSGFDKIRRELNHKARRLLGPVHQSSHDVLHTLFTDHSAQSNRSKEEVKRIVAILGAMVARPTDEVINLFQFGLRRFFPQICSEGWVEKKELLTLSEISLKKTVVYVARHRSHLDYLAIPGALFLSDLPPPYIVAGSNLSFWPLGALLRRGGALFIRRSFRGEQIYRYCLEIYLKYLFRRKIPLLFFIEGTRSRTGKGVAPTFGVLKQILGAKNVVIVPVSVTYAQVLERDALVLENKGTKKARESVKTLINARELLKKKVGKSMARFGEPLTLDPRSGTSIDLSESAHFICQKLNGLSGVTPESLLSCVLLSGGSGSLSMNEIFERFRCLEEYSSANNALFIENGDDCKIEGLIKLWRSEKKIEEISGSIIGYRVIKDKRALFNFDKNGSMHVLAIPAMASLATVGCERWSDADFHRNALWLKQMFEREFFFNVDAVYLDEVNQALSWIGSRKLGDVTLWIHTLIADLVESYVTVIECCKEWEGERMEREALLANILVYAERRLEEGGGGWVESLCVGNYHNAILWAERLELVVVTQEKRISIEIQRWNEESEQVLMTAKRFCVKFPSMS